MMADIKKVLSRLLEELDAEDKDELLDELKNRKITAAELVDAIKSLPPESRKEVRAALIEVEEEIEEEEEDSTTSKKKVRKSESDDVDEDDNDEEDGKKKTKARTRPGRKSGHAYDWWVDEDGKLVRLDIARVYSGPDEPDKVEMLPVDEDEDEDDEENEEDAA